MIKIICWSFFFYITRNELDHSCTLARVRWEMHSCRFPLYCQVVGIRNYFDEDNVSSRRKYSNYIFAIFNFWNPQKSCIPSSPLPIMLTANLITLRGAMEKQFHIVWCWDCQSTVQHNLISLIQIYFDFLRIIFYQAHQALLSRSIRIAMQKANMWERQEKKLVSTQRQWITEYLFFVSWM